MNCICNCLIAGQQDEAMLVRFDLCTSPHNCPIDDEADENNLQQLFDRNIQILVNLLETGKEL